MVVLGVGAGLWCPLITLPGLVGAAPLNSSSCLIRRMLGERNGKPLPMCCVDRERIGADAIGRAPPIWRSNVFVRPAARLLYMLSVCENVIQCIQNLIPFYFIFSTF